MEAGLTMGSWHTVEQGEFLAQIARDAGFHDPDTVWNAPENSDLRQQRKDPHVLTPGDRVFIPDVVPKELSLAQGQEHVFQIGGAPAKLRMRVLDVAGTPIKTTACVLTVDGKAQPAQTDDGGLVEGAIVLHPGEPLEDGALRFATPPLLFHLEIGNLNDISDVEGQQARLNNLGYFAGFTKPNTQREKDQLIWAVEEFQCDHQKDKALGVKLVVDGTVAAGGVIDDSPNGQATRDALVKVHGS
jgi:hypothetical protein